MLGSQVLLRGSRKEALRRSQREVLRRELSAGSCQRRSLWFVLLLSGRLLSRGWQGHQQHHDHGRRQRHGDNGESSDERRRTQRKKVCVP
jgi:hypothetical protein